MTIKCPHCGEDLVRKKVEKLLKGGVNTALLKSEADVCLHCGERLYSPETVKLFERIREKLLKSDVADLRPIGRTFQAA